MADDKTQDKWDTWLVISVVIYGVVVWYEKETKYVVQLSYSNSSPNTVSSNTDFTPTWFWFRDKKIRIYLLYK